MTLQVAGGAVAGPLDLVDTAPDAAGATAPPRFRVSPATGDAAAHYTLRPVRRGVHRIGPLVAYGTDPWAWPSSPARSRTPNGCSCCRGP